MLWAIVRVKSSEKAEVFLFGEYRAFADSFYFVVEVGDWGISFF